MLFPQSRKAIELSASDLPVNDPAFDIDASRTAARATAAADTREDVAEVGDVDADGVRCRLYRPDGASGLVLHIHGGGFVMHDIDVHDAVARRLANRSGAAVLSVDYRRPPEHRFPAAPDDVDTVVDWIADQGLDSEGVIAHGDSAGGNLALGAALRHPGRFKALVLIYPFLDARLRHDSWSGGEGFGRGEAAWYWQQYAASPDDYANPDFSPYDATDLSTLPPTLVITAEHDPCRDEGEAFALRIAEAGVSCVTTRYIGLVHGFWRHVDAFDAAEPLTRQIAGFVQQHLGD